MTKKIDLTNGNEVVDFLVSKSNSNTKEYYEKELQKDLVNEINYLGNCGELNTTHGDETVGDDELCKEGHEYFDLTNEFKETSKVDSEDYSLTEYELTEKYGEDGFEENFRGTSISIKDDLTIDQLESLASEMQNEYYSFGSYEIDKEAGYIIPEFHQYATFQHSKFLEEKSKYENFKYKTNEKNTYEGNNSKKLKM